MSNIINFNPDKKRQFINRVRDWAKSKNLSPEQVSWSYLRVAMLMDNAKSQYTFQLRKDTGNALIHDKKLDLGDTFVVFSFGHKLLAENPAQPGTGLLQTYPNNQVFPAVAGEVTPAHLNIFYNGKYDITVDKTIYVPDIATDEMLVVRTTQQSAAGNFSERFNMDGTIELGADVTLNGSRQNEVTLTVPTFAGLQLQQVVGTPRNYVVLTMFGCIVSGGGNLGRL